MKNPSSTNSLLFRIFFLTTFLIGALVLVSCGGSSGSGSYEIRGTLLGNSNAKSISTKQQDGVAIPNVQVCFGSQCDITDLNGEYNLFINPIEGDNLLSFQSDGCDAQAVFNLPTLTDNTIGATCAFNCGDCNFCDTSSTIASLNTSANALTCTAIVSTVSVSTEESATTEETAQTATESTTDTSTAEEAAETTTSSDAASEASCCEATNGCTEELANGGECGDSCCCCPSGMVCDQSNFSNGCVAVGSDCFCDDGFGPISASTTCLDTGMPPTNCG